MAKKSLDDVLAGLRLKFIGQLQDWLPSLESACQGIDKENREHILFVAHRITGSGGTLGFTDLSKTAQALEEALIAEKTDQYKKLATKLYAQAEEVVANVDASTSKTSSTDDDDTNGEQADGKTIMVVDDDENIGRLLKELLTDIANVKTFTSSTKALSYLDENTPDLLVVDNRMAEKKSGLEFVKALKNNQRLNQLHVVMLTASSRPNQVLEGLLAGAQDYVTKPFDPTAFKELIQERLSTNAQTILIADDDPPVRELLGYKFKNMGYGVLYAENGQQVLDMLANKLPSLVILDRMMPGMDGLLVLKKIRQQEALKKLPVIILTAKHYEQDILDGLKSGADDYIVKPFNPSEVVARAIRFLER